MSKLSIFQIYEVSILVDHKNIRTAAKSLNIDESTFRRHISQIESILGKKLYSINGNKLEITKAGQSLYASQLKSINGYLSEYSYSINKIKTAENTIKILCQSDYLKVITQFVAQNTIDLKINLELISENEFFRLNPSQLLNHYAEFDCILMHEPHQLKMSHQWKMQSFPTKSHFVYHQNFENTFKDVTINTLENYSILNARLFLDKSLSVFDSNNPEQTKQVSVHSHVQSDSIRNNIALASRDKFILHLPAFIPDLYPSYPLIKIPNLYLNYLELNFYFKAEISEGKLCCISKLRSYLKDLIAPK